MATKIPVKQKVQKVEVVKGPMPMAAMPHKPMAPSMPHLGSVSDKVLPAIKNWKVGQTYKLELEVKMVGHRLGNDYETMPSLSAEGSQKVPKVMSAEFEVTGISTEDPKGTDDLKSKFQDRARS